MSTLHEINKFLKGNVDLLKGPVYYYGNWCPDDIVTLRQAGWTVIDFSGKNKDNRKCLMISISNVMDMI
jgi:hypothetical protein